MCNQLGFTGKAQAVPRAQFGAGTGTIWLQNVDCSGTENFIDHCNLGAWGDTSCSHSQDAGVVCACELAMLVCVCTRVRGCVCIYLVSYSALSLYKCGFSYIHSCTVYELIPTFPSIPASNFTVPVRLVNGSWPGEGRLEVKKSAAWGTLCDTGFGSTAADVVCRQLGFYGASAVLDNSYFGPGACAMYVL